jgi:hypothetical protein
MAYVSHSIQRVVSFGRGVGWFGLVVGLFMLLVVLFVPADAMPARELGRLLTLLFAVSIVPSVLTLVCSHLIDRGYFWPFAVMIIQEAFTLTLMVLSRLMAPVDGPYLCGSACAVLPRMCLAALLLIAVPDITRKRRAARRRRAPQGFPVVMNTTVAAAIAIPHPPSTPPPRPERPAETKARRR